MSPSTAPHIVFAAYHILRWYGILGAVDYLKPAIQLCRRWYLLSRQCYIIMILYIPSIMEFCKVRSWHFIFSLANKCCSISVCYYNSLYPIIYYIIYIYISTLVVYCTVLVVVVVGAGDRNGAMGVLRHVHCNVRHIQVCNSPAWSWSWVCLNTFRWLFSIFWFAMVF